MMVGQRHRVEFAHSLVSLQYGRRIFPGYRRTGFDLSPAQFGTVSAAESALGDEVIYAATALGIAGIPVLHRGILHFGPFFDDYLHHGGMQLVFVAHRRRATLQIGYVGIVVGNDQRALELSSAAGVDAEIGAQLHRTPHALGYIDERSVGEHRRIQRRIIIVTVGHDSAEIFAYQLRIVLDRLGEGAEDHAEFRQMLAVGRLDADGVHHGVDCHAGKSFLFLQADA